jgi:magnesium transporter
MKEKVGLAPGSAIYTGTHDVSAPQITIIKFNLDEVSVKSFRDLESVKKDFATKDEAVPTWLHVEPISDQNAISELCEFFHIHPLAIEDILSVAHRPVAEEYENYLFVVLKYVQYTQAGLTFSQISLVLKDNLIISFADESPQNFDVIKKRLEKKDSRMRKEGSEYLLFTLIDYLVDQYFIVLETIGEEIEALEDEIIYAPTKQSIQKVHNLKRTLMELKKSVWPTRELINTILQSENINEKYFIYYKDTYDHIINIIDIIEGYRDSASSFLDIYLSTLSNRMNEIMKTLSIISTIFIPLSFMTGYFGMNFKHETILESQNAFDWSNIVMIIIPLLLLGYFRMRKWF